MNKSSTSDWFLFIAVIIAAVALWWLSTSQTGGQEPTTEPPVEVEWVELQDGWVAIDQKGDGMVVILRKSMLANVVLVEKGSDYAKAVYRDDNDLVVISVGADEWRVRCPDKKTALDLTEFLVGELPDGKR